jgi:hypothetical protein
MKPKVDKPGVPGGKHKKITDKPCPQSFPPQTIYEGENDESFSLYTPVGADFQPDLRRMHPGCLARAGRYGSAFIQPLIVARMSL